MATMIERGQRRGYAFRPVDVSLIERAFPVAGLGILSQRRGAGGLGQFGTIEANPLVCAAVAGLVGAAGGFFGARGALKGKGMAKKKMQQQIAMYAVGATAVAGVIGYFLCGKPAAPTQAAPTWSPRTRPPGQPEIEPLR